jgi:hypothetical protein
MDAEARFSESFESRLFTVFSVRINCIKEELRDSQREANPFNPIIPRTLMLRNL